MTNEDRLAGWHSRALLPRSDTITGYNYLQKGCGVAACTCQLGLRWGDASLLGPSSLFGTLSYRPTHPAEVTILDYGTYFGERPLLMPAPPLGRSLPGNTTLVPGLQGSRAEALVLTSP